jgi:hypothetical protein
MCPYTVATEGVLARVADLRARGEELPPPLQAQMLDPGEVADAVIRLVEDDTLAGRVLVLVGGEPPRLLPVDQAG